MTVSMCKRLAQLRADFPGWLVWQVGDQWWAMQKGSHLSAHAGDPDLLAALLRKRGIQPAQQSTPTKAGLARA